MAERRDTETASRRARVLSAPARWSMHHRLALSSSLARLRRDAFGTTLLAVTLGVALALPVLLYLGVANLQQLGERWDGTPTLNLFLDLDAAADAEALQRQLTAWRAFDGVAEVNYMSPDDALAEFTSAMGFADAAELLQDNPLPPVALVTPTAAALAPGRLEALVARLERESDVVSVQVDLGWVQRLRAALEVLQTLVVALAVLLALAVVLVIGSQTRTAVEQGAAEIRVYKLIGGTDGFVLRPFLYRGALYGLMGGVVACVVVWVAVGALDGPLQSLAASYDARVDLRALSPSLAAGVVAGAGLLGLCGALLAARRRLSAIEP